MNSDLYFFGRFYLFLFCYTDFQLDSGQVGWGIVAAVLSLKSIERSLGSVWNHRLAKTSILVPASSSW